MFNHLADDVQDFSVRFNPFKTDNGLRLEMVKYKVTGLICGNDLFENFKKISKLQKKIIHAKIKSLKISQLILVNVDCCFVDPFVFN